MNSFILCFIFLSASMGVTLTASTLPVVTVKEVFFTTDQSRENIDSPAAWVGQEGEVVLYATSKAGHSVNVFDGRNGAMIRRVGGLGVELGQFSRPNGIWIEDDLMWVVERDNQRVQVLRLPEMLPITSFGEAHLRKPYGLYVHPLGGGDYRVYVTDSYEGPDGEVPASEALGQRVHKFLFEREGANGEGEWEGAFGATSGEGQLFVVESIFGDPAHQQLLVAEELEDDAQGRQIKVYDFEGNFTGKTFGQGIFQSQVEGIALYPTSATEGYWIITDQSKIRNLFHVFSRSTWEHLGSFEGERTLNTDGVWLTPVAVPRFPAGLFYACDNDKAVAAFDLKEVFEALNLPW